jgi:histone H3/H4
MPPKKQTKKTPTKKTPTKKTTGAKKSPKKPASKATTKTTKAKAPAKPAKSQASAKGKAPAKNKAPGKTEESRIKDIQEGKDFALDNASVIRLFKSALASVNPQGKDMSISEDAKVLLKQMIQDVGVSMAKRAYMIESHKRKDVKSINGPAVELAFSICSKTPESPSGEESAVVSNAFTFASDPSTPRLKPGQLARLAKASVPMVSSKNSDVMKYISVGKTAKEQLQTILTIFAYDLAKRVFYITQSAKRKTVTAEDLKEASNIESEVMNM